MKIHVTEKTLGENDYGIDVLIVVEKEDGTMESKRVEMQSAPRGPNDPPPMWEIKVLDPNEVLRR